MPTLYTRTISDAALRTYGKLPNLLKTVEELSELQRAISRYIVCQDVTNTDNLHEEIADVEIMLDRLRLIVDPMEIESWKAYKFDRTAEKLGLTVTAAKHPAQCATPTADACALDADPAEPRPGTPVGTRKEAEP